MIIWGIRTKSITGQKTQRIECPRCGNGDFDVLGAIKYIHLFWIPLFIVRKKLTFHCTRCRNLLTKKELDADFVGEEKKRVFTAGRKLPLNFGILLLGTVLILFFILVAMGS